MAYDGKLLARARDELDKIREENRAEQQRRLARAYARLPELEEVDAAMRSQMTELVRLTVSRRPDLKQRIEELKQRNLDTQRRRAELLSRGGMDSQMWTINLILLAVAYGGALERCGCIETLFGKLKHKLHSVGSLILATLLTSLFCDATMCDQFLGIGVPAPLYMDKYDEMGLGRNMLSRTLEDCGTLWAVMFPWTGCGAYQMGVLGVHPFAYFPFAFVNLLNPIYAAITAFLGRNIFWADGAYTNILGKTKMHKPAGAPEEAHELAVKNLNALREAGKAPKVQA